MKKVKRNKVWETNSSSIHSLCIDNSGMEPSNLPIDKDGYIVARYGNFGRELEYYSTQEEKLSYLLTQAYYISRLPEEEKFGKMPYTISDCYYGNIIQAVCHYITDGIQLGIKIEDPEGYIDHQSIPYDEIKLVDIWDEESIQQFIFNKYITLKTSSD